MKTRSVAAVAATAIASVTVLSGTAFAAASTITGHGLTSKTSASTVKSLLGKSKSSVAASHTSPRTAGGITPSLTVSYVGALTFVADATASTDSASTVSSYTYDFGDGTTQTVSAATGTATHTYNWAGTYTVTVTVTDAAASTATSSVSVTTLGSDYTAYGPARILDTRNGTGTGGTAAKVGAKSQVKLTVAGAGTSGNAIPANVTAVVLNVTVTNPTAAGYITVYPDGVTLPQTSNLNYATSETVPNLVVVPVTNGVVDLFNSSTGKVDLIADVDGYFTQSQAGEYVSMSPYRLLDTRTGTGATKAKVNANSTLTVTVDGVKTIQGSNVTAVALNLTVTNPTKAGFVTAYPSGSTLPTASNVNYAPGETVPNEAIVPVGADGKIKLYNGSAGTTDLIADVTGYFVSAKVSAGTTSAYYPLPSSERVLDTRTTTTWDGTPLNGYTYYGVSFNLDVTATGFVMNATVTNPKSGGYLTLYPYSTGTTSEIPNASNLNFGTSETVPNLAIVSTGNTLDMYGAYDLGIANFGKGSTDLVLDLFGVFFDA